MLGLIVSTASFAKTDLGKSKKSSIESKLFAEGQSKVRLVVEKQNIRVWISLEDSKGNVIYKNNVYLEKPIIQSFDVSALEPGKYEFTISAGKEKISRSFVVQSKHVTNIEIED